MSVPSTFNVPTPSQTASLASSYRPPLAGTSVSNSPSATSVPNPNPSTPALQDDHQWITAYLNIHQLSLPSYRYTYILWLVVVLIFLIFAILHWTGSRGGVIGGLWSKWSLRRRTWRKKHSLAEAQRHNKPHKQPLPLPSNAQLLSIAVLYIATFLLCFLGPDYIAPATHVWDLSHNLTRRDPFPHIHDRASRVPPTSSTSQPAYTIAKAWWTAGGRTGTMAFALFPLCVLFALKAPPFALFALPFLIQIYSDKLAVIHRWSGRLIWLVTVLHIALWSVQLSRDKRGTDNPASVWSFAFEYDKFLFGWLGFICFTLLVALSLRPVRVEFYETFYILHALLIPLTLIFSALHFPPIGWWCWATLALWGAERLWRLFRFLRINGIVGGTPVRKNVRHIASGNEKATVFATSGFEQVEPWQKPAKLQKQASGLAHSDQQIQSPATVDAANVHRRPDVDVRVIRPRPFSVGQETVQSFHTESSVDLMSHAARPGVGTPEYSHSSGVFPPVISGHVQSNFGSPPLESYMPPPGYAHATLLPGRTIRLRLITPHFFTWAPGQHVLLNIPSVSRFTSHPFTIASICDEESPSDRGREIVLLIRARTGFTKKLWTHVESHQASGSDGDESSSNFSLPKRGILLRAYVDGPFGSSIRARWTSYSTILIVAGGSGVSFAAAVLEYVCMCMAGRNGKHLGGRPGGWGYDISQISRVRFIWIAREFSHIQWVASTIRRCIDMVPSSALQVDIFVTNVSEKPRAMLDVELPSSHGVGDKLIPPSPNFAHSDRSRRNSTASEISLESGISDVSYIRAPQVEFGAGNNNRDIMGLHSDLGHEEHVLDLTNFDGEDDTILPGESQLSRRLLKEGKLRRAKTRKSLSAQPAKDELKKHMVDTRQPPYARHMPARPPSGYRPSTPPTAEIQSPTSSTALHNFGIHDPLTPVTPMESPFTPFPQNLHPKSFLYAESEDVSRSISPAPSNYSEPAHRQPHHTSVRQKVDMDALEAEDMSIVSERARRGRARIDRIVTEEAERSRGAIIVACCGPTSLTAVVRKTVAAHIDPSRILRGDMRASITLVSEDFEW